MYAPTSRCRCASSLQAAAQLAEQLPRLVPSTFSYSSSASVQLAALQLAGQLLHCMPSPAAAAGFLLGQVPVFLQHKSVDCRRQLQHLLESVWRMLDSAVLSVAAQAAGAGPGEPSGQQPLPEDTQLLLRQRQQVEALLFVLASDRSAAVQAPAAAFWHDTAAVPPASGPAHTLLLPRSPVQRLTALLQQVSGLKVQLASVWEAAGREAGLGEAVARDAEGRWPCVAAGLLLQLPAELVDAWGRSLFGNDLADCEFTDYPVQTQVSMRWLQSCLLIRNS